jgi:apolipoprotein N-acyltransferase
VSRLDFAPWDVEFTPFWYWADKIRQISNEVGIPILVGSQTWTAIEVIEGTEYLTVNPEKQFNSAVLVQPDGLTERYDKIFLTPFGERIPYLEHLTTVKNWIRDTFGAAMLFDLHAGGEPNRFVLPAENLKHDLTEITFATPICFEDTVPSVVRNLVWEDGIRKAGALINLSNDGWFGSDSSAHEQHVREARMRCIENQTPMVRAANTGISCYIDENGRVRNALPILEEGILPILVQSGVQRPMSRFIGDSVAWVCLVGGILLVVVSCSTCRKGQEDENTM